MKYILTIIALAMASTAVASESNQAMKACLIINGYTPEQFETFDFRKAAKCHQHYRLDQRSAQLAEMREFLKANPRYRYPGQSNNKCWGKPREMPFESAYIKQTQYGFEAGVSYKDTLPAGCYENGPWDNRDVQN